MNPVVICCASNSRVQFGSRIVFNKASIHNGQGKVPSFAWLCVELRLDFTAEVQAVQISLMLAIPLSECCPQPLSWSSTCIEVAFFRPAWWPSVYMLLIVRSRARDPTLSRDVLQITRLFFRPLAFSNIRICVVRCHCGVVLAVVTGDCLLFENENEF